MPDHAMLRHMISYKTYGMFNPTTPVWKKLNENSGSTGLHSYVHLDVLIGFDKFSGNLRHYFKIIWGNKLDGNVRSLDWDLDLELGWTEPDGKEFA